MNIIICAEIDQKNVERIIASKPNWHFLYKPAKALTQSEIDEADLIIGNPAHTFNLNTPRLKALLLNSAGNDRFLDDGVLNPDTLLTNASGSYGPTIAEHALGMLIAINKNFPFYFTNQLSGKWQPSYIGKELYQSTVAIVGYGDIGHAFAKRVKAFDTHIIAFKKHPGKTDAYIDELYTTDDLKAHIGKADYVFLSLPETKETIHLFDEEMFEAMKKGSVIINVGRGSAIETAALIKALESHHLYGAALDVVEPEPLPSSCPLYHMDNVIITPHASGGYHWESVQRYFTDLVIRNLDHFAKGEELENLVDRTLGYRAKVVIRGERS